jgi:hypothetical protein
MWLVKPEQHICSSIMDYCSQFYLKINHGQLKERQVKDYTKKTPKLELVLFQARALIF